MNKFLNKSRTSIEADFQQSIDMQTYIEYIMMINQNLQTMTKSLAIAEGLIQQYKQQNAELRKNTQFLNNKVNDLEEEVEYLKQLLMREHGTAEKDKIRDLNHKNQLVQRKISDLVQQLQKSQAKINRLTKFKQQKAERDLHNFFQFPKAKQRSSQRQDDLNRQIRSLRWKLEQKQQEITYMIKRNKILQESKQKQTIKREEKQHAFQKIRENQVKNYKKFRKVKDQDRFFTCQTDNNRSHHI